MTTKETAAERKARLAQDKINAEIVYAAEKAKFRAEAPKRLAALKTLAESLNVHTVVTLADFGPVVRFEYDETGYYIEGSLNYDSVEWEFNELETQLNNIKAERDAYEARRQMAQDFWNNVAPEMKPIIKEFIYLMR